MAVAGSEGDVFGYLLNRLEPAKDGSGAVCTSAVPAGAPLLAMPLASCWTAERARRCKVLAQALRTASDRNPRLELLQSDTTWIALHLLLEKKQGDEASALCRAHLALLPEAPETVLAWSTMDLAALQGSQWRAEVVRRRADLEADFCTLLEELGPVDAAALGLDEQGYAWARQVLLQLGLQVLGQDGRPVTLLAPGMERLRPDTSTPPSADSVRLEFPLDSDSPMLVLSASRPLAKGEPVGLAHAGLACCNGRRLLGCGWPLRENKWDAVEVSMEFGSTERSNNVLGNLAAAMEWNDGFPALAPGDCLSADAIDGWTPVSAAPGGARDRIQVRLRLTREEPLPGGKTLMAMLGTALLGDVVLLNGIMEREKDMTDVLGQTACERRALLLVKDRLSVMLKEFPKHADSVSSESASGSASRAARARETADGEKEIISLALAAITERLASPLPAEATVAARGLGVRPQPWALTGGEEPVPGSQLGEALSRLRGCSQQLAELAVSFRKLAGDRKDGEPLQSELQVLRSCLRGSRLGDPGAAASAPLAPSPDLAMRVHGEATAALMGATRAAQEWEIAALEREVANLEPCADPGKDDPRRLLAETLMARAGVQTRLRDFPDAIQDLVRATKYWPGCTDAKVMARDCAATWASRSDSVLVDTSWSGCGPTLKSLRSRLEAMGYLRLGATCPPRGTAPLHAVLEAMWTEEEVQKSLLKAAGEEWRTGNLTDVVRLFLLRRQLPLRRAVELLGAKAVILLLDRSAFTCYRLDQAELLDPREATRLAVDAKSDRAEGVEVFSNIALWPLGQGLLVAADFEQGLCTEGKGAFEPVPYPAEDTEALIAGAAKRKFAENVLHACCGCGAEGLVALQHYAQKVTFLDSNRRALCFARFSAHLNDLADRATFLQGSLADVGVPKGLSPPFDAVLLCSPFLPNPDSCASSFGPLYVHGGPRGDNMLKQVVGKCARHLLRPGGWLLAVASVPNVDGFARRLTAWADAADAPASAAGPADFRAAALCGQPRPARELLLSLLADRPELEQQRYLCGLRQADIRTLSEVVLVLAPCPSEVATRKDLRVELQRRSSGLWSDAHWPLEEVQGMLDAMLETLNVGRLIAEGVQASPLYSLNWVPDGPFEERSVSIIEPADVLQETSVKSPWRRLRSTRNLERPHGSVDGCTWQEVMSIEALGFSPPMLCDVYWAETPKPEVKDQLPKDHIALLEIKGCRLPAGMEKALRRNLQATTRYTFDGKPRAFQVASGGSFAGYGGPLEDTDVLIVPLLPGVYSDAPLDALPTELVLLLQAVSATIEREQRYITVFIVTHGSSGPVPDRLLEKPSAAVPIQGLARVARTEFPLLPLICLDTDAFGAGGDALTLALQVSCELEATDGTMEVAYRQGKRFTPRVKLSSRNLIRSGCKPPSLAWADEDGCVLITGGLGGLGVITTEALMEAGARRFVLVSRSGQVVRDNGGAGFAGIMKKQCLALIIAVAFVLLTMALWSLPQTKNVIKRQVEMENSRLERLDAAPVSGGTSADVDAAAYTPGPTDGIEASSPKPGDADARRMAAVRDAMVHSWGAYVKYAWGHDELRPVSRSYEDLQCSTASGPCPQHSLGLTILDAMDTLWIMDMKAEWQQALDFVRSELDFKRGMKVSVFETTIRMLGGLLSAYDLSGEQVLLDKAQELGDRLVHAFDNGVFPRALVNLGTGASENWGWTHGNMILAEVASLQMEWRTLSLRTGKPVYDQKVTAVLRAIRPQVSGKLGGLMPTMLDGSGRFASSEISLGAFGDSAFEYLLKLWVLNEDSMALDMFNAAKKSIRERMLQTNSEGMYIPRLHGASKGRDVEHLTCFAGGMFAMAYHYAGGDAEDLRVAEHLAAFCHSMYAMSPTGLAPDVVAVSGDQLWQRDAKYILRPETVETYFYLWRITHDQKYRDWGWDVLQACNRHLRVDGGYSGTSNVFLLGARQLNDKMESFWLAETLKYLYLLFADDSLISLKDYVFNTEAHPFRRQSSGGD